ncbi:hypothetical protein ACFSO7_16890 [Bacillus sp. CGMCC 1.16607]|uniref:hypothetical protein n=1 Tax=Bacillus sp. CGMCC 1.16607 TaxID=3351842 RepID=UPI003633E58C
MVYQTSKTKWGIYLTLLFLILIANYTLYHQPIFLPFDKNVVIASLIDFIIVIPIMTYFFIIRKKYSIKAICIPILGGYAAAHYIIPQDLLQTYSQITWIVIGIEVCIIGLELFILYKVLTKLPTLINDFKKRTTEGIYFFENISITLESVMPKSQIKKIMSTEMSIYFYSLFSYRKKPFAPVNVETFTYHQKTSVIALNIMLIHAIVIETIGIHYFLHQVNPILSYILLFLNVYSVLLFLAEIQATRLSPIQINSDYLIVQIGLMKRIKVPFQAISQFNYYNGPEKLSKKELEHTFDARVNDFIQEKPMFEIALNNQITASLLYGFTKKVDRLLISVDEADRFYQTLNRKLQKIED